MADVVLISKFKFPLHKYQKGNTPPYVNIKKERKGKEKKKKDVQSLSSILLVCCNLVYARISLSLSENDGRMYVCDQVRLRNSSTGSLSCNRSGLMVATSSRSLRLQP